MTPEQAEIAGVVVADATEPGFPIVYVSPGFEALTGYRAEQVLGRSCSFLQGPDSDPRAIAILREALAAGHEAYTTMLNYRADGSPFWNEIAIAPERDRSGRLVRYLGVQKDVTARRHADARIHELAYYDTLTGLANRAALHDALTTAVEWARSSDSQLALMFVDIDDFKRINDTHGHLAGDEVLRLVAERLRTVTRPDDVLARPGGDEFLLLIRDVPDAAAVAADVARRIAAVLREPVAVDSAPPLDIRVSVGVSAYPRDATSIEDMMRHADTAMYTAKARGKDGFHLYRSRVTPTGHAAEDLFDPRGAVDALTDILARGAVTCVYQPIVEIDSGAVIGYEALARGPEDSDLHRPDRLFATAEVAGRVAELDWLCRAAAVRGALEAGLRRSAVLFINCEPSVIGTPCPPEHSAVWSRGVRELDLVLEITERAVTDRPGELWREVGAHRSAGRGIALDDVGADVRSLALLPLIEPDVVKLDLRLVQDRPSTEQAAIVAAVSAEHERIGITLLAEGIETEAHLHVARSLGATLGQGWLWGRPGPLVSRPHSRWHQRRRSRPAQVGATPFEVIAASRPVGEATKRLLLPMSHHLENRALGIGEGAVLLSAFQEARHFTPKTLRRYEALARGASFVAAFGVGLDPEPAPGVRGAGIPADDPLSGEWSVLVVGPHFAGALVAQDLGDLRPESERRFAFATTYDRALVLAAARTLLARVAALDAAADLELRLEPVPTN